MILYLVVAMGLAAPSPLVPEGAGLEKKGLENNEANQVRAEGKSGITKEEYIKTVQDFLLPEGESLIGLEKKELLLDGMAGFKCISEDTPQVLDLESIDEGVKEVADITWTKKSRTGDSVFYTPVKIMKEFLQATLRMLSQEIQNLFKQSKKGTPPALYSDEKHLMKYLNESIANCKFRVAYPMRRCNEKCMAKLTDMKKKKANLKEQSVAKNLLEAFQIMNKSVSTLQCAKGQIAAMRAWAEKLREWELADAIRVQEHEDSFNGNMDKIFGEYLGDQETPAADAEVQ
jgi:hypothetical protein